MTKKKVNKAVEFEEVEAAEKPKLTNKQRGAIKRKLIASGLAKQADLHECNTQSLAKNTKADK